MNTSVFVLLIAVGSVKCGMYELDSQEQHNGLQTPFLPVAPTHYIHSNSENNQNFQLFHVTSQPAAQPSDYNEETSFPQAPYPPSYYPTSAPSASAAHSPDATHSKHTNALIPFKEHGIKQNVQPALPTQMVSVHKTIVKHIEVPYPVDKYVKVDRHVQYPVNRYYRVDRPYEVIKYVEKPYIVKVERKVPVQLISKIPVPQPIVKIEPIIAKPQHIHAHQLQYYKYKH